MNKHKLSLAIVIPVYNEEDHLKTCLDAIMEQTVQPDEVIVIDNNSTDNSRLVAESYPNVRVISEAKQGIAYARDAGFNAVCSDLIARIDADTHLAEDWVEQIHQIYDGRTDFALTGGCYFYNVPAPRLNGWITSQLVYRLNRFILGHYVLWGSNMVIPRRLWQRVRNDVCSDRHDIHEDLDLAIHLHRQSAQIVYESSLVVGVEMKRVYRTPGPIHKARMDMWPNTLYAHGFRRAWLGQIGAWFLYQGRHFIRFANAVSNLMRLVGKRLSLVWFKLD